MGANGTAVATRTAAKRPGLETRETVANILSHVRSERGALTAAPGVCVLAPRLVALVASRHLGGRLALDCRADLAALVEPAHLDLIVGNLLSNAAWHGGGATALEVRVVGEVLEVTVSDAGPGVPAQLREGLFRRYHRDDARRPGLGLFISREVARANGGDLTHSDRPGGGAVFRLTLPAVRLS